MHKSKVQCKEASGKVLWGPRNPDNHLRRAPPSLCLPIFSNDPTNSTIEEAENNHFTSQSPGSGTPTAATRCPSDPIKLKFWSPTKDTWRTSSCRSRTTGQPTRPAWRCGAFADSQSFCHQRFFQYYFFVFVLPFTSHFTVLSILVSWLFTFVFWHGLVLKFNV